MDYRKQLCKCTKCEEVYIDTIPNTHCLRVSEEDLPKRIIELTEDGCPECKSWDHLVDTHDLIVLQFRDYRTAREQGKKEYPGAIFLKSLPPGSNKLGTKRLNEYQYVL